MQRQCAVLGLAAPEPTLQASLRNLAVLTPGDFAAVARRHRFAPLASPAAFVAALSAECAVKTDGNHAPIGFI